MASCIGVICESTSGHGNARYSQIEAAKDRDICATTAAALLMQPGEM
jgi:hypothetical protein